MPPVVAGHLGGRRSHAGHDDHLAGGDPDPDLATGEGVGHRVAGPRNDTTEDHPTDRDSPKAAV